MLTRSPNDNGLVHQELVDYDLMRRLGGCGTAAGAQSPALRPKCAGALLELPPNAPTRCCERWRSTPSGRSATSREDIVVRPREPRARRGPPPDVGSSRRDRWPRRAGRRDCEATGRARGGCPRSAAQRLERRRARRRRRPVDRCRECRHLRIQRKPRAARRRPRAPPRRHRVQRRIRTTSQQRGQRARRTGGRDGSSGVAARKAAAHRLARAARRVDLDAPQPRAHLAAAAVALVLVRRDPFWRRWEAVL